MIIGMTRTEAINAWKNHQDVLCPCCEFHVDEEDACTFQDEVFHYVCYRALFRENTLIAESEMDYF
jgi:hypothetical protein